MRVIVESGNYFSNNNNFGDRAIYQSIVGRLLAIWPNCEIQWITSNARLLIASCPEVLALELTGDRQSGEPGLVDTIRLRTTDAIHGDSITMSSNPTDTERLLVALRNCDLVVATGGGYFSDGFSGHALTVLDTLEAGTLLGKPAVILSCGFEPICNAVLSEKMLNVLPKLDLVVCREPLQSKAVVRSFGVAEQRVMAAGDEAVELAFNLRAAVPGNRLGVNLRQSDYAGVDAGTVERLRENLRELAGKLAAPLVGIPISAYGPSDPDAIGSLLAEFAGEVDDGRYVSRPEDVIRRAGGCRLVITGSYHAAVFSLSQGVPVVGLTASAHYRAKLRGLQAQFGIAGCRIVELNRDDSGVALARAVEEGWRDADTARPALLRAALRQIAESRASYDRLREIVEGSDQSNPHRAPAGPVGRAAAISVQTPSAGFQANGVRRAAGATPTGGSSNHLRKPEEMTLTTLPALSPDEIETFRTQGFLGPFTAFDAREMERARTVIYDRVLPTPTPYCPFGLRVRHLDSRTVYDLCSSPEIVGRMASLYGPNLVLWNSNLFDKPPAQPDRPEEYPWHQDHYNWNMEPVLNISAWLAIGPATLENGCVEVIPGSHRQIVPPVLDTNPRLSLRFGGVASDPRYIDETRKVSLPLESGQFFLFNERLLHHSNPNLTRDNRLGLAIRVTVPIVKVSEPFPCVLLLGEDGMGFNRYADRPTDEPDAEWLASLPPGHTFMFDRPIPGMGWHVRETDGSNRFAWTGLEPTAWIDFRPTGPGDHFLRCEVVHMLSQKAIDEARICVNGALVTVERSQSGDMVVLVARVPERVLKARNDRVRISLEGSELLRPCDLDPTSTDKGTLGLGVRHISLAAETS